MSAPSSTIYICSGVRLNSRYDHTIYFASASAQLAYFNGKVVRTFSAYTFLRKTWPLQVAATMEEAKSWSYLFFQNGTGLKRYFYFINNVEQKNNGMIELTLELDVLQTYMFDYELLPCFVERQHVEDDTVGKHTQEEGLDVGDYKVIATGDTTNLNDKCILVLASTTVNGNSAETVTDSMGFLYNGTFSGLTVYAVPVEKWVSWADKLLDLSTWGKIDSIVAMWMYPKKLVKLAGEATWENVGNIESVNSAITVSQTYTKYQSGTIDGYTPKNNKLFTHPYNLLYVTNNNGSSAVYKYERFEASAVNFLLVGGIAPDAGVYMYPTNYNGGEAYAEGLSLPPFPTCAWDADGYKIWLAQNQNQHRLIETDSTIKTVAGVATAVGSALMGNPMGAAGGVAMAYSGMMQKEQLLAAKADKAVEPPQARGSFSTSVNMTSNKHCFTVQRKTITAEYAKRIDDYFTMAGYKINQVKTPNRHARKSFTYIKTIDCHISSNLCNEDAVKIEQIFDKGITWWVNGDKICDYSQDNGTL